MGRKGLWNLFMGRGWSPFFELRVDLISLVILGPLILTTLSISFITFSLIKINWILHNFYLYRVSGFYFTQFIYKWITSWKQKHVSLIINWFSIIVTWYLYAILALQGLIICDSFSYSIMHSIIGHILTLKLSRGVPMDPKISFRTLARKREVIFHLPSMTLSNFTLRLFWW